MKTVRIAFHLTCLLLFIISAISVVITAKAESVQVSTEEVTSQNADRIALELDRKRQELLAREQALVDRERSLDERESEIEKKMKELVAIRDGIHAAVENNRKANEEKVNRMVVVFESMQPKMVAQVFETLDDFLAVDVLKKMDTKKTAKVMNLMDKNRSAKLSEMLTGYYRPEVAHAQGAVSTKSIDTSESAPGRAVAAAKQPAVAEPAAQKTADSAAPKKALRSEENRN